MNIMNEIKSKKTSGWIITWLSWPVTTNLNYYNDLVGAAV